ncbi:MAG: (d)CMP kinase [Fimbriimonadaceae bacterium]|nr:(d)CMP kinase [Chthonomonadaceae bacterium]MCO5296909.1 (d)CMP kinase [Fimbriimonadaceae bacterium]
MSKLVIAIDGPAGSGKSTVAKRVARELGLSYLDTGAMYRAVALKAFRAGFGPNDGDAVGALAERTHIGFGPGDPQKVFLDGEEVTSLIRTSEIGELASALSAHTPVRRALVARQRELIAQGGVTLEGRDTTTVVAPNADLKVFMTASVDVRARRRTDELLQKGLPADLDAIRAAIEERDHRDSTRADSPLKIADDAVVIETDHLTVEEVVRLVLSYL